MLEETSEELMRTRIWIYSIGSIFGDFIFSKSYSDETGRFW
jgi:hypothetical protein